MKPLRALVTHGVGVEGNSLLTSNKAEETVNWPGIAGAVNDLQGGGSNSTVNRSDVRWLDGSSRLHENVAISAGKTN